MKKKLLKAAVMLIVVLIAAVTLSVTASAATEDNYTYTVTSKKATITDFKTSVSGSISIPSTLGGYPVIAIGDNAFEDCSSLTSVTIPSSVTTIGNRSFRNCTNLTSITIPNSVTTIGIWAFQDCTALPSVSIPISVTNIGDNAFYNCDSLKDITIPYSVTKIGNGAFRNCNNLTDITVNGKNENYCSVGGVLFNKDMTELILYPTGRTTASYEIPSGVTTICEYAFAWCDSLTSVTIPDSVIIIERNAFVDTGIYNNSDNWENGILYIDNWLIKANTQYSGDCTIKSGTKGIGNIAFYNCDSLTSISIPDSVTTVGDSAFYHCSTLTSISIPDSVTTIGRSAFGYCSGVTRITLNGSITSFGDWAFCYCTGLTSVVIDDSVTVIGSWAFEGCTALTDVYYIGNATAWNNISIGLENDCLTNATRHYITEVKIIYNANGGINAPTATISAPNTNATLSSSVPTRTGYAFCGWETSANATEAKYQAGDTIFSGIENITLYAIWKRKSITNTGVTQGSGYKTYQVELNDIPVGSAVIIACYNSGLLTHIEVKDASDTIFNVPNNILYNEVKVFVWDNLTNINPITEAKNII